MIISTIVEAAFLSTTAEETAYTIDDLVDSGCNAMPITTGLEVMVGEDVFEYDGADIYPKLFNETNTYAIGDVVVKDCKLHVIETLKSSTTVRRHKEPEEYGSWESTVHNWKTWTKRYLRVPYNATGGTWNKGEWKWDSRWYFVVQDSATRVLTWVAKDTVTNPMNCPPEWYLKSSLARRLFKKRYFTDEKRYH